MLVLHHKRFIGENKPPRHKYGFGVARTEWFERCQLFHEFPAKGFGLDQRVDAQLGYKLFIGEDGRRVFVEPLTNKRDVFGLQRHSRGGRVPAILFKKVFTCVESVKYMKIR